MSRTDSTQTIANGIRMFTYIFVRSFCDRSHVIYTNTWSKISLLDACSGSEIDNRRSIFSRIKKFVPVLSGFANTSCSSCSSHIQLISQIYSVSLYFRSTLLLFHFITKKFHIIVISHHKIKLPLKLSIILNKTPCKRMMKKESFLRTLFIDRLYIQKKKNSASLQRKKCVNFRLICSR